MGYPLVPINTKLLFLKVVLHSSYDMLLYETLLNFFKTAQVKVKSKSKVMPVFVFYLLRHL